MEISEEFEDKILISLVMNTDISGEGIRRIIDNIKNSDSIEEADALLRLGLFFSRTIIPMHSIKLGYWDDDEIKKMRAYIKNEDFRCKDDESKFCNVNCRWFRWCFICDNPLCQLKDDWIDTDSDFCHRDEHEVLFGNLNES